MRNFYFWVIALFAMITVSAQTDASSHHITVTDEGSGILKIEYNGTADSYSFFSPGVDNPIYVYSWLNTGDNSTGNNYNDKWSTVPTVILNYDSATDTFVGTINLGSHDFDNSGGILPGGTSVNRYNFLFRNSDGTSQSTDTYQLFSPVVTIPTLGLSDISSSHKSFVSNGKLYTTKKGNISITIYDFNGRIVKTINVKANGNAIDLNVHQNGMYLAKISDTSTSEVVKFRY